MPRDLPMPQLGPSIQDDVHEGWLRYTQGRITLGGLMDFHARHKYLIMAHSPRHYRELGRLVAEAEKSELRATHERYLALLLEGLNMPATVNGNTNVLLHLAGYFKRTLKSVERAELLDVIGKYHDGRVPLNVPVALLNHYVTICGVSYLAKQVYLRERMPAVDGG